MKVQMVFWEENGYHDSDFFRIVSDLEKEVCYKELVGTTRGAMEPSEMMPSYHEVELIDDRAKAKQLYIDYLLDEEMNDSTLKIGDTVVITSGRKYPKGNEYVVTGFSEYRDRYGRVQTEYVNFEGGRTSISNVELVSRPVELHRAFLTDYVNLTYGV